MVKVVLPARVRLVLGVLFVVCRVVCHLCCVCLCIRPMLLSAHGAKLLELHPCVHALD
jgi:hypothetical protein